MVEDDVENDFDAFSVQAAHHCAELINDRLAVDASRIAGFRGEESERVVAPVVGAATAHQSFFVEKTVYREQVDCRDAQSFEVLKHGFRGEPGKASAQFVRHARMLAGSPFDMDFVEDGFGPGSVRRAIIAPIKSLIDDARFQAVRCR